MRSFAAAISFLLVLSACAEGVDDVAVTTRVEDLDVGASTTSTSPVETTTTTVATTTSQATTTTVAGVLIRVVIESGEVTVNGPTTVPLGEQVTIRVRSDVEDVVVVDAYEVSAEVAPGSPAGRLVFTADQAGTHAVTLQNTGEVLFSVEVTE